MEMMSSRRNNLLFGAYQSPPATTTEMRKTMVRQSIILATCLLLSTFALAQENANPPGPNENAAEQAVIATDKDAKKAEKEKKKAEKEKKKAEKEAQKEERRKEHEARREEQRKRHGGDESDSHGGQTPAQGQAKPQTKPQASGKEQKAPFEERFKQADANGDGKLSKAEAGKGFTSGISADFDAMDTNKDGFVTAKERHAFVSRSQATSGNK